MSYFRRLLGLSGLLGLVAALALAIPAQASQVKLVCIVNGEVKMRDNVKPEMGMRVLGGDGHYDFTAEVVCTGTEKGVPVVVTFFVLSTGKYVTIFCPTSKWRSPQGKTTKPPKVLEKIGGGDPAYDSAWYGAWLYTVKYDVEFIGPKGWFYWHNDPGSGAKTDSTSKPPSIPKFGDVLIPDDDPRWKEPNPPKEFVYAGELVLGPSLDKHSGPAKAPVPPDKVECAKAFDVNGVIVLDRN